MNKRNAEFLAISKSLKALPGGLSALSHLEGKVILASGCTGFFGKWVHIALDYLNSQGMNIHLKRLERHPDTFLNSYRHWASAPWSSSLIAQAEEYASIDVGAFDFALHMATTSSAKLIKENPSSMARCMINGTSGMLEQCAKNNARMLMISSGAIYGKKKKDAEIPQENSTSFYAPDVLDPAQLYGESKRAAESMCAAMSSDVDCVISRPFAFLGPHLPLHEHFAAGNFLKDAAAGRVIEIKGDGSPIRSYMHPADMTAWHFYLLCHGKSNEAYNVGSDQALSLANLAELIAKSAQSPGYNLGIQNTSTNPDSYLPSIKKAKSLGLRLAHSLDESIMDSLMWLKNVPANDSIDW